LTRLINIDNGGTLTDICVIDGDDVQYTKTLTTPFDLSSCLFEGLTKASAVVYGEERLAALLQTTDYIRYSTTQGTNALVQRKGHRLGLLVADSSLYDRLADTPGQEELLGALVGDRHATVAIQADDDALSAALVRQINALASSGASRLVVSIGGEDGAIVEGRLKRLLLRLYPRQLLGAIPLLFSWELAADRDDVRRTWSSLLNAFLHPAMERFLFNAESRLREHRTRRPLLIFRNDGGSSRVAKSAALKTYSSGPRGGLEGARALARHYGLRHVLMVDVGGTTTDVGVVTDGAVHVDRRGFVDDAPTSFELAAITSHGVGGSSVIRLVDGQLTVGPESVGAAPGPACFGLGGTDATITDVYLLMGILDPSTYLGGTLNLDAERSAKAVTANVAEPLGIPLAETLARMEDAYLERVAAALGTDGSLEPDTVIAAFGGAGPMTVCGAARRAGVRQVLVPRTAAVFSAFGIGFSDVSQHYEHPLPAMDEATVAAVASRLRERARRDMFAEGVEFDDCDAAFRLVVERNDDDFVVALPESLDLGANVRDGDIASLELSLVAPLPHVGMGATGDVTATGATSSDTRTIRDRDGVCVELPVYSLLDQPSGAEAEGPAVVEGPFFTMRLPDGWRFQTTAPGDVMLTDHRSK
jgi:N-methylhydantoinase A/oxoprolinase/acetone carboxylase beta subunit